MRAYSKVIYMTIVFSASNLFSNETIQAVSHQQKRLQLFSKPNWKKYNIEVSGKFQFKQSFKNYNRNSLRSWAKEKTLQKASTYLEHFLVDDKTMLRDLLRSNASFARGYAIFIESLYLEYFSIKKNYAYADIIIRMRGNGSLLSIIPLPWASLSYQELAPSEYIGEAYQTKEANSTFSNSLAPVIYSGLILDVRGYQFQPSLSPKIYSQGGQLIYGAKYIHPKLGLQRGIAGFSHQISSKEVKKRTGEKPMFIAALGTKGKYRTNAVISYQDQQEFFDHKQSIHNLLKCKVAFIID